MMIWLHTTWDRLRSSYWFIPTVMAVIAIALSFASIAADTKFRDDMLREQGWFYTGGSEGARAVLSVIAGSIITVAGTTFSITVAALSLASAQFGPRLLHNFMRDTGNQVVLGTFTSTFLYCLLVLRTVRGLEDNTYVPHLSVTLGVVLAVASLGVLIYFIHHVAESIQVAHIIQVVGYELKSSVERLFPERIGAPDDTTSADLMEGGVNVRARSEGYIQAIDSDRLMRTAVRCNVRLHLTARPGDYVISGETIAITSQTIDDRSASNVQSAFTFGRNRTSYQDAAFAFLQLTEIAVRALSPGVNDPFTAIMCIDQITAAMCYLADRSLPHPVRHDPDGIVRVIARRYEYDDLVEAGYGHIRESAALQSHVSEHLRRQIRRVIQRAHDSGFRRALEKELNAIGGA
jgi:uncharacterized membrane protein